MSPFADYSSWEDCIEKNQGKVDDPAAYCAAIKRQTEDKEAKEDHGQEAEAAEGPKAKQEEVIESGVIRTLIAAVGDLVTRVGQLLRRPDPDRTETDPAPAVVEAIVPATSGFTITKDARGSQRWFGFVSGNFKDRDQEVFPADVHEEYIAHLDATKEYPELRLWHAPGTRFGQADWAEFEHGFLLMSGTIDAGKEALAEAVAGMSDQGMSHGFRFKYRSPGVIGKYRSFEVSVLPLVHAAFPWSRIEISKEVGNMRPEKRQYLESLLGKEKVEQIIAQAESLQKSLIEKGIDWKALDPAPAEVESFKDSPEYKALADLPEKMAKLAKEHQDVTAIFDAAIKALQAENAQLRDQVATKADDMLAALIRPRAGVVPASRKEETRIAPDSPLAQAQPRLPVDAGVLGSVLNKLG